MSLTMSRGSHGYPCAGAAIGHARPGLAVYAKAMDANQLWNIRWHGLVHHWANLLKNRSFFRRKTWRARHDGWATCTKEDTTLEHPGPGSMPTQGGTGLRSMHPTTLQRPEACPELLLDEAYDEAYQARCDSASRSSVGKVYSGEKRLPALAGTAPFCFTGANDDDETAFRGGPTSRFPRQRARSGSCTTPDVLVHLSWGWCLCGASLQPKMLV